jgi:chloramphenicol-sensitive protein RarD
MLAMLRRDEPRAGASCRNCYLAMPSEAADSESLAIPSVAAARLADPSRQGVVYGILSYGFWGLVPLYFKLVATVAPQEVVAQRIVWSFVLLSLVLTLVGRWSEVVPALQSRPVMTALATSTLLLAFNWFVYIYAVSTNQVVEASIGYFLNPLVNVVIGVLVLKEHLRRWQLASVVLAGIGVAILGLPWIAVSLALSFAFYGLLRKQVAVDGLLGLFVETLLLAPLALGFVLYLKSQNASAFVLENPAMCLTLAASGIVTCVPLLLFAAAARRLRFATLGFLQYLAPTVQFLIAVFIFGEPLSTVKVISLSLIWTAVGMYSLDSLRMLHQHRMTARETELLEPGPADV